MKSLQLFCVYDSVSQKYFPPFADDNSASAMRQFGDILSDPKSALGRHVADYQLYRVAEFRVDTGVIHPLGIPELLSDGGELFKPTLSAEA